MMSGSLVRLGESGEALRVGGVIAVSEQAARESVAAHAKVAAIRRV
jgi:hypothetical protein